MKVGILGATGAVGRQMIVCLAESGLPVEELRLFASGRSAGKTLEFNGLPISVEEAKETSFAGLDYVLGATANTAAGKFRPAITDAGAVFIDNSSAFRLDDDVPLVVPEINGEDALGHHGVISNPNCSSIITYMALAPLNKLAKIRAINAVTFQAVSGAGISGLRELADQSQKALNNEKIAPQVFRAPIAFNVIAMIGDMDANGFTSEEMKMQNEGRKIMHLPDLTVDCTCVRVPVFRSHSIALTVRFSEPVEVLDAQKAIAAFPGDILIDDHPPMPLEASDQNHVLVGRIRRSLQDPFALVLWCCGDQIRKGAAANAVGIIDYLVKHS